ncbi:DNA or RNA helicase of superfamily II [Pseudomonas luteola]|uniref:cysteine-rich CWC family protein n=1 Tax=Pseudomonas luteola TaxID=47886 RepID=UPI000A001A52|nr:cysteine-rich CWC family protein [Pseudomonas luteola]RRW43643.1 DNA or RNA helicase of superfamily II [Pseudomonas luteola]
MNTAYPSHLCPRCGQSNGCAQLGCSQPVTDCWCFHTRIAPEALETLPGDARNVACLCARCASATLEHETDTNG